MKINHRRTVSSTGNATLSSSRRNGAKENSPNTAGEELAGGARSSEDLPSKTNIADGGGPDPGPALGLSAAGSAGLFARFSPALFKRAPPSSGTLQAWTYQRDS